MINNIVNGEESRDKSLSKIDEEEEDGAKKTAPKDFQHLNLFKSLMKKTLTSKTRKDNRAFMPKDLGVVEYPQEESDEGDGAGMKPIPEEEEEKHVDQSPNGKAEPEEKPAKMNFVAKILAAKRNKGEDKSSSNEDTNAPFGKSIAGLNSTFGLNMFNDLLKLKSSKVDHMDPQETDTKPKTWRF